VLLSPENPRVLRDRDVVENARIYEAACLIGSGKPEAADEPLRAAIRAHPQMKPPDSLLFPPPVIDRFLRVRESLYEEIKKAERERVQRAQRLAEAEAARKREEDARQAELERLATREIIIVRNRRWIAGIPFGVGQFQNGDEGLGWVFLTSEAVLGATALTALGMQTYLGLQASERKNPVDNGVTSTWNTLLHVSSYAFLSVAVVGVLDAELRFVPEFHEERYRPLPERLRRHTLNASLTPSLAVAPGQFSFGVSGKF
jgi:hypothetical protein